MSLVSRELSITYGTTTIGGASSTYLLHGSYRSSESYASLLVEFEVVCLGGSESAFVTNYEALETAFRTPRQALTITLGSQTKTYQASDSTGFNISPTITRPVGGSPFDSGRSRLYSCSVDIDLPADKTGDNALREKSVEVKQMPTGQRIVQVGGAYTASGSTGARAQYTAQIDALIAATKTDLGITEWDTLDREVATDYEDKVATFRVTCKEIIFDEASGTVNVAAIQDHRIALTRTELGPGDSDANVVRPIEMAVVYECQVDKSETTDLRTLYDGTIFPYLIELVQTLTGSATIAVKRNSPTLEKAENRINTTVEMTVFTGSPLLASFTTSSDEETIGVQLVPCWNGNPHAKYIMPAEGNVIRRVRTETLSLGEPAKKAQPKAAAGDAGAKVFDLNAGPLALDPVDIGAEAFGIFGGGALNITIGAAPGGGGGAARPRGAAGGGAAAPAGGGAIGRGDVPGFGKYRGGAFLPIRRRFDVSPVVEGVAPHQVSLTREVVEIEAVYVVDPRGGGAGPGTFGQRIQSIARDL